MSSFIFVVILAVWAVYLVQHWVRRRDHLATARSVDRFSESMRVLERRRSLPRPDLAEHTPPATSLLLRPARPAVVVKRGESAAHALTRVAPAVATAVGPTSTYRHARLHAQVRAAGLLAASVVTIALVVLTVAQVLHWVWSFVGLGLLAVTVLAIRWSVSLDRAGRRASVRTGTARGRVLRGAVRRGASAAGASPASTLRVPARSPLAAQARAAVGVSSSPARRAVDIDRRPAPVLYDIDGDIDSHGDSHGGSGIGIDIATDSDYVVPELTPVGVVDEQPDPALPADAWSPVPVPPPTYTLKARALRGVAVAPTGATELPLDGTEMALDEEFEELPSVDRVG